MERRVLVLEVESSTPSIQTLQVHSTSKDGEAARNAWNEPISRHVLSAHLGPSLVGK